MRKANDFMIEQLQKNAELRREALKDATTMIFMSEDKQVGLMMLRDIVNATCGFEELARRINKGKYGVTRNPKTIMHALSKKGNPGIETLRPIVRELIAQEDMQDLRFGEPEKEIAQ